MSSLLAHRGADGAGSWIQGPAGLACRIHRATPESLGEVQPLVSGPAALVFDGRLDNREELLESFRGCPAASDISGISSVSPDPALVLAAYHRFGDEFPGRLNGDFALALFDGKRQRLLLARDSLGVRPLYYHRGDGGILFASEIKALLAHPGLSPRPDDEKLSRYLLGSPCQDDGKSTFFEGIHCLPPAHVAVASPEKWWTRRYWDFDIPRQEGHLSFEECAEGFRYHFGRALRRRLRGAGPVAVLVSGGLDSSAIFCQALRERDRRADSPLLGISYSSTDGSAADESRYIGEIERAYGVEIERVPPVPGILNRCRRALWHAEAPLLDDKWNNTQAALQAARRLGARVVLTGHWGDEMLLDWTHLVSPLHRLSWREVWSQLREMSRWFGDVDPRRLRRRYYRDLLRHQIPGWLVPLLRPIHRRLTRGNQLSRWYAGRPGKKEFRRNGGQPASLAGPPYQEARSGKNVLKMEWHNKLAALHGLEPVFPFLDRDLLSFLMAVPGGMKTRNGVPKALLREAMRGVLPEAIRERRWKADWAHRVNEGMREDFPRVLHHIRSGGLAVELGYVKRRVLEKELPRLGDRLEEPNCIASWSVAKLLALELWLQVFFGEKKYAMERHG